MHSLRDWFAIFVDTPVRSAVVFVGTFAVWMAAAAYTVLI